MAERAPPQPPPPSAGATESLSRQTSSASTASTRDSSDHHPRRQPEAPRTVVRRRSRTSKAGSGSATSASRSRGATTPTIPATATADDPALTSFPSLAPESPPPGLPSPPLATAAMLRPFPIVAPATPAATTPAAPPAAAPPSTAAADRRNPHPTALAALTAQSRSFRGARGALFDDSPGRHRGHGPDHGPGTVGEQGGATGPEVPGALHLAPDATLARLVARAGAVPLVRQLAADLAAREAELSRARGRAEARERALRALLREAEVAPGDVEARLRRVEEKAREGVGGAGADAATAEGGGGGVEAERVRSMMEEALDESLEPTAGPDGAAEGEDDDGYATVRAPPLPHAAGSAPRDADGASTRSSQGTAESKATTGRGWRDYIWSGSGTRKTSRTSSSHSARDDSNGNGNNHVAPTATARRARAGSSAAAAAAAKRTGLSENVFQPPPFDTRSVASDAGASASADKPRSASVASWTLKLFAGNPHGAKETSAGSRRPTSRGRATTQGTSTPAAGRVPSQSSTVSTASAQNLGLTKARTQSSSKPGLTKPLRPLNLGPTGTLRGAAAPSVRSLPLGSPAHERRGSLTNLGPVEMDAILPEGSRPPTLTPSYQNLDADGAEDYLTDRFGFIYDQRRRKKEADALAAVAALKRADPKAPAAVGQAATLSDPDSASDVAPGSRPGSPASKAESKAAAGAGGTRWQDYLQMATYPTELLVHTPSPSPGTIMTLANAEIRSSLQRTPTFGAAGGSAPATAATLHPAVTPASVTATTSAAGNAGATITHSVPVTPTTPSAPTRPDSEPVRALLQQLTDVHERLQREKEARWNEFLRKVRADAERRRADDATAGSHNTPEAGLADGALVGIATLGRQGKAGRARYRDFQALVRGGIPVALRAKVWAECSGAAALRVPGAYTDLVHGNRAADDDGGGRNGAGFRDDQPPGPDSRDDPAVAAQIEMDIPRTLTDNVFFRRGPGAARLRAVLTAYARRNGTVGYCQGMNLIAGALLLALPTAEAAFWLLAAAVETVLPPRYFDAPLLASRADTRVLRQYVGELLPRLARRLDELGVELEALTFPWFLSLFTACLSAEALYRVWDVLLCRGPASAETGSAAGASGNEESVDHNGDGGGGSGSTVLFCVALALLRLNEAALLACPGAAALCAHLQGAELAAHAISIDGLVRASEALRAVVRREDVEARRARFVAEEEAALAERARLREELRSAGKGAARSKAAGRATTGAELQVQVPIPVED